MEGKLQREGEVIHVIVKRCYDLTKLMRSLSENGSDESKLLTLSRADEKSIPAHVQDKKDVYPKGRNFK